MDLPDVIRTRRAALGLSQTELANAAKLHVRQIARYEAGEQQPSLSVAVQLAEALDVSLNQLAGQIDDELNLTGWVMNAHDERSVDLVAAGEPASLEQLERRLHVGPPGARVESVAASRQPASGEFERFGIVRG